MNSVVVDGLIVVSVFAAWLGTIGALRLRWALDRLHTVAFVTVACGLPIVLAGFVADGLSIRAFKLLLAWLIMLVAGGSLSQAVARAIFNRREAGERA